MGLFRTAKMTKPEYHLDDFSWKSVFWDTSGQQIHIQMLRELPGRDASIYIFPVDRIGRKNLLVGNIPFLITYAV